MIILHLTINPIRYFFKLETGKLTSLIAAAASVATEYLVSIFAADRQATAPHNTTHPT
jgi:hypothetical protein